MSGEVIQFSSYAKKIEKDILEYLVKEKLILYRDETYLQENFIFSEQGKRSLLEFVNQGLGNQESLTIY